MALLLLIVFVLVLIGVLGCLAALAAEVKAREAADERLRRSELCAMQLSLELEALKRRLVRDVSFVGVAQLRLSPKPSLECANVGRLYVSLEERDSR